MDSLNIVIWCLSLIFFTKVFLDVSETERLAGMYGIEFEFTPLTLGLAVVFYMSMIYLNPWRFAL